MNLSRSISLEVEELALRDSLFDLLHLVTVILKENGDAIPYNFNFND